MNQSRNIIAVVVVGILAGASYFSESAFLKVQNAEAGESQNVSGWVWSETIGWISLNSLDCDQDRNGKTDSGLCGGDNSTTVARDYGVNMSNRDTGGTGAFSGRAWSPNIGWISFNRTETSNPPSAPYTAGPGEIARVDWSSGKVTGWARALSACQNSLVDVSGNCTGSGSGDASGGWDGWIKLSDDSVGVWNGKGVRVSGNEFRGYAWGGNDGAGVAGVTGWIDFAPSVGGVFVGPQISVPPCTASGVPAGSWGACQPFASSVCTGSGTQLFTDGGTRTGICTTGGTTIEACDVTVTCIDCPPPKILNGANQCVDPTTTICGNGICETGESFKTCPSDCKMKVEQF